MINVIKKLIVTTHGEVVSYQGDKEVSLADLYGGVAIALRMRESYDTAIENMRTLIQEEENKNGND